MNDFMYLDNQLLIATPSMMDPYFQKSVVYICEHNDRGAMGIIINHPMSITIEDLLVHMEILSAESRDENLPQSISQSVLAGGPVQRERGFVIHRPAGLWQSSFVMPNDLTITTSRDILQALIEHNGPEQLLVALGYAGWEAGQLEVELASNAWINCPVDFNLLFATPAEQRWEMAGHLLGVNLFDMPNTFGHA
jgi:putative transcriptional regulator